MNMVPAALVVAGVFIGLSLGVLLAALWSGRKASKAFKTGQESMRDAVHNQCEQLSEDLGQDLLQLRHTLVKTLEAHDRAVERIGKRLQEPLALLDAPVANNSDEPVAIVEEQDERSTAEDKVVPLRASMKITEETNEESSPDDEHELTEKSAGSFS